MPPSHRVLDDSASTQVALSGERTSMRSRSPRPTNSATTWEPTKPLPPVTNTRTSPRVDDHVRLLLDLSLQHLRHGVVER